MYYDQRNDGCATFLGAVCFLVIGMALAAWFFGISGPEVLARGRDALSRLPVASASAESAKAGWTTTTTDQATVPVVEPTAIEPTAEPVPPTPVPTATPSPVPTERPRPTLAPTATVATFPTIVIPPEGQQPADAGQGTGGWLSGLLHPKPLATRVP